MKFTARKMGALRQLSSRTFVVLFYHGENEAIKLLTRPVSWNAIVL